MTERLICLASLAIGYGFGLLQIAQIYSKSKNVNIREKGSGNAGTTNMFRVMGIKAGIITLLGDCAKCVAAVLLTKLIFLVWLKYDIDSTALALYTGFGCVLGHDFPFYFRFKGGKGMATTAALICCLGNWQMIIIGVVIFFGIVLATQYVSLGSMVTICSEAVMFIVFTLVGWFPLQKAWRPDSYILMIALAALLVFQHRKNIKRLLAHNEKKFYFRTASQIEADEAGHREEQVNARLEQVQNRAEKKVDKLQSKVDKKVAHAQNKMELVQNKADYKERKVQLKAEFKDEKTRNWAGKIAEHAPKSLKQKEQSATEEQTTETVQQEQQTEQSGQERQEQES